jgi:hypothetical protein
VPPLQPARHVDESFVHASAQAFAASLTDGAADPAVETGAVLSFLSLSSPQAAVNNAAASAIAPVMRSELPRSFMTNAFLTHNCVRGSTCEHGACHV